MIRAGTSADADAVARVHVRTWQEAYAHVFPPQQLSKLSVERRAAQWREWPPLVAEVGGAVVGFVSVGASRDNEAGGELFDIYVDPDHWGNGIGRELMAAGEDRLRALGQTDVFLWVLEDNPRARRFYERASWYDDGGRRQVAFLGVDVQEVRYRKRLDS
jgi:ribosomal protein S18 acetylase RimI-like enzyme